MALDIYKPLFGTMVRYDGKLAVVLHGPGDTAVPSQHLGPQVYHMVAVRFANNRTVWMAPSVLEVSDDNQADQVMFALSGGIIPPSLDVLLSDHNPECSPLPRHLTYNYQP